MAMGEADVEGEVGSDTLTGPCGGLLFSIMRCSVPATRWEAVDDFEHMKTYGILAQRMSWKPPKPKMAILAILCPKCRKITLI